MLGPRLATIASLVPKGSAVLDVGTDHGYLSIGLLRSGRATYVIASDVMEKPLNNCRLNVEREVKLDFSFDGLFPHFETPALL